MTPSYEVKTFSSPASDEKCSFCEHYRVQPRNYVAPAPRSKSACITFSYKLDEFQRIACECVDKLENVLVSAHTSAGKSTVALYAIQAAVDDNAKVVYTSPIKALSNQKFRDISEAYPDKVGLLTGDVCFNPAAQILIVTTEILRSMLFRGSAMMRELKWVIFDEVHYMRDRDRGVIWEEAIVLLPNSVNMIFLSATIPNSLEFASWICETKTRACNVVSTSFRPTPLCHYLFSDHASDFQLVKGKDCVVLRPAIESALAAVANSADLALDGAAKRARPRVGSAEHSLLGRVVAQCIKKKLLPVIVFAFSRREVQANAQLFGDFDLTDADEKAQIKEVFDNALATLSAEDRRVQQFAEQADLLVRGFGMHHGGLIPLLKEVTEILFEAGMIRVLFSTETFSMGLNMPARSVVFTNLRKYDGETTRMIAPSEYIQMSGRAGRRGLDPQGHSIVLLDFPYEAEQIANLLDGQPDPLDSRFHLMFSTVLNLLRVQGITPRYIIRRSFYAFQNQNKLALLLEQRDALQRKVERLTVPS
uniref:Uncharacterized helicase C17H9.02-like n=1 Tax=Dermatophagoides pteronyssinus TaxID=6956 RepID=A0A6P6Y9S8_DERPT|nr:uncharacterized helicase C17H9.02-like [Dermatophagoides pteronyssinus]